MPVTPSTAYPSLGNVFNLVRSLVNDVNAQWASDNVILPYANCAYRTVGNALGNVQAASFIKDNVQLVVTAIADVDPGTQASITDQTAPPNQLPPDLLVPLKVWERPSGSTDEFVELTDVSDSGGLPSVEQGTTLDVFEWRTDGLYFVGATQDVQIRLRYEAAFLDLTDATSSLLIRNGQDAVAFKAAMLLGVARGSAAPASLEPEYLAALEDLKSRSAMREQNVTRRRRGYNDSRRGWGGGWL